MRNALRDFFRRRRVERHIARCGEVFEYHGLSVSVPREAGLSAMNALLRGKYEREEAELISRHLPPDLPVVELGGSLGVVSRLIRSRLSAGTQHLIVEANADLVPICRANAGEGQGASRVVHAALYHDGPVARFRVGADVHASALDASGGAGGVREVPAVTLAALLKELGEPEAFVLVSDIEGAEYALFDREADALRRAQLAIIEIHPKVFEANGHGEADFIALAARAGLIPIERRADVVVLGRRGQSSASSGAASIR